MAPCFFPPPLPPLLPLLQSRYTSCPNHYSSAPTAYEDHLRGRRFAGPSPIPSARYSSHSPHWTHWLLSQTRSSGCTNRSTSL
jgi:hypothetical protein